MNAGQVPPEAQRHDSWDADAVRTHTRGSPLLGSLGDDAAHVAAVARRLAGTVAVP